jgi:magnesium-transporting ATPase (P-type)
MKINKYINYIITYSITFVFIFFLTKITGVVGRPELPIHFTPFSWKEMLSEIPYVAFMSLFPLIAYIYVKRNINKDEKIN